MLVLPIAQRSASAPQGQEGEQSTQCQVGDRGAEGLKVGVKNTFIDIREAETPDAAALRGAQTAMARISGGAGVSFSPEGIKEAEDEADAGLATADLRDHLGYAVQPMIVEDRGGPWSAETPLHIGEKACNLSTATTGTARTALSFADGEVKFDTSSPSFSVSGPIPPPPPAQAPCSVLPPAPPYTVGPAGPVPFAPPVVASPMTAVPSSHSPFSAGHTPVPAPPAYAAPVTFENQTSPPPALSPRSQGSQTPMEKVHSLDREFRYEYNVKNTFVEVQDDLTPVVGFRHPQTCQARFASGEAGLQFLGEGGAGLPSAAPPVQQLGCGAAALLSLGSAEHGRIGEDGQPVCQPCAWFYKESGCRNAQSCRYCHLCPSGELKNRKKAKIARLRNQDDGSPHGALQ